MTSLLILVATYLVMGAVLFSIQHKAIYRPHRYEGDWRRQAGHSGVTILSYETQRGPSVAYYHGPAEPRSLWMIFCGNATLALQWVEVLQSFPGTQSGFLLMDYPGYGNTPGTASPSTILEETEAAFAAVANHVGLTPTVLAERTGVLGHSLGCAAALQWAARHPIRGAVLIAPFTSVSAMATRMLGPFFNWLLVHRFDNAARLRELEARRNTPAVLIIHGGSDRVIPVTMGRTLAAAHPSMVTFEEIANGGHDSVINDQQALCWAFMAKVEST